jgi:hypothetical protein
LETLILSSNIYKLFGFLNLSGYMTFIYR